MKLLCNESFAAQRRWASFPLCAAVIWLITSICSSRRAASSSLSAGWALSVSSRGVGSDGKQHPSALSSGILSVPYPCCVASPKIKLSETPEAHKSRQGRLVILELSHKCSHPPTVTVAILHQPMSPYAPGLRGCQETGQGGCTAHPSVVLPAIRASLGFRHGAAIRLQGKQYGVLRQYFPSVCIWWVLVRIWGLKGHRSHSKTSSKTSGQRVRTGTRMGLLPGLP